MAAISDSAVTGAASIALAPNDNALAGINVSTATALFDTLHAALNGNTYSITDTGAALLTSATDPAVTGAATITLAAGDATLTSLSVASAITLFDTLHAAQNGDTYAITDTAANLVPHATDSAVTGASFTDIVSRRQFAGRYFRQWRDDVVRYLACRFERQYLFNR